MKQPQRGSRRRHSAIYRQSIALNELSQRLLSKNDKLASEIAKIVKKLTPDSRINKAKRHIYDAYYLRTIRNDIDQTNKKYLKFLWHLENNQIWIVFLFLLTIIYQIMTFFEPAFSDRQSQSSKELIKLEIFILTFLGIDTINTIILLATKKDSRFTFNPKRQLKLAFYYTCLIDFIINQYYPTTIRFSTICRPLLMPMYSKDLRRNLNGIFKASKDLFLLIILYIIIISIFSFVGINLIGRLENVDQKTQDYGDFFKFFSMLFMVSTLDFYPDVLIPPMMHGAYYSIFFIVYLLLFIFLFAPIPLAVVYEGFKKHRMEIAISDIIKQKTAMMASFIALDQEDFGYLSHQQFKTFIQEFYKQQIPETRILELFLLIDSDFNDKIQFDEFYKFLHLLQVGKFSLPEIKPLPLWESFRNFLNTRGFRQIIEGKIFQTVMLVITITNCILIITAFFINDLDILATFDTMDTVFLILYSSECLFKIVAFGIKEYFDDGWNNFDFSLVVLQILLDKVLYSIVSDNLVQSITANRLLRLAKIQKVFRLFRAFRSIKVLNVLLSGLEFIDQVRTLIYKIIFCIPLIFRLMLPVQMIFFIYSLVGMYLYGTLIKNEDNPYANTDCNADSFRYSWGGCQYADFTTFSGSYLLMLQMFIAASWNQLIFELTYDTDDMVSAMVFIGSFEFVSLFLLSLIGGLVWEVFSIVSLSMKEEEDEVLLQQPEISPQGDLLSGTQETKQIPTSGASQMKKKTLILYDDKPDEIKIQQKRTDKKSKTTLRTLVRKFQQQRSISESAIPDEKPDFKISPPCSRAKLLPLNSPQKGIGFTLNKIKLEESDVSEYYRKHFQDYEDYKLKKQDEGMHLIQVTAEYITHLRNEIKKEELLQKNNINITNHQQLLQSAMLQNASEGYIKSQEDKYFRVSFGKKFERIKELKFESKFKIESKILFSLMGILKFPEPQMKYYFQILYLIENQLTYQLLADNSFMKIIYQINNKWYTISIDGGEIAFHKLDSGIWDYAEQLFTTNNLKICESLSALHETGNQEYLASIKQFGQSVKKLASHFEIDIPSIDINSSCLVYQIKNEKYINNDIYSFRKKNQQTNVASEEQSPNNNDVVFLESQNLITGFPKFAPPPPLDSINLDEYKYVSRALIFVLAKTHAQEQRIVYKNLVMLSQFVQDLAKVIHNYESNFFKQIESLYALKIQQKKESRRQL